jgi:hypothetical protein
MQKCFVYRLATVLDQVDKLESPQRRRNMISENDTTYSLASEDFAAVEMEGIEDELEQ